MFRNLCPEQLDEHRQQSWDLFERLGLPAKRSERYRQIPVGELYGLPLQPADDVEVESSDALLFVDGSYRGDLSSVPAGLEVAALSAAQRKYGAFLKGRFAQWLKEEDDPFAALSCAMEGEGAFLYLPPGKVIEEPIDLHFLSRGSTSAPRLHLFLGKGASCKIAASLEGGGWVNRFVDITLEEGATLALDYAPSADRSLWLFDALRAQLKRDSSLRVAGRVGEAAVVRSDYRVALIGEGASVELIGGARLRGEQRLHNQVLVEHLAPHCQSRQLFKTVLDEMSRATFNGKIYVEPIAQQTDAFQLNNNLILSDGVIAHSLPNLEIFADDVKASHGSTVGKIDEEQLYYLRSRGVGERLAREMVVDGFLSEVG